jgi:hypothetical protein
MKLWEIFAIGSSYVIVLAVGIAIGVVLEAWLGRKDS